MDRRSLLALFSRPPATALNVPSLPALSPEAVYEAARRIRGRIDDALAASREEVHPASTRR